MTTLDTPNTLHIRCGSDIQRGLQAAGFIGDFLEFSDPFCQGPVGGDGDWTARRNAFLSTHYEIPLADLQQRQTLAYKRLGSVSRYAHIVLWFEHDNYDQLILAYLLTRLADANLGTRLELICISVFAGIEPFIGLGQLSPDQLEQLYTEQRQVVSAAQYQEASKLWYAFEQGNLTELNRIIRQGTQALPFLAAALKRQMQELPWTDCGMGLTLQLTLQMLRDKGPCTCGQLFRELTLKLEPLPHLGDLMFWALLKQAAVQGLIEIAPSRTDWPMCMVSIATPTSATNIGSWWVGPFDINRTDCPRWDPVTGQIVVTE